MGCSKSRLTIKPDKKTAMVMGIYFMEMKQPMKLLKSQDFISFHSIPRSSDEIYSLSLDDLRFKRNHCFITLISHRWWGSNLPDTPGNSKHKIISKALTQLQDTVGSDIEIFVWIDYFCIDQDSYSMKIAGIQSLPGYISNSDCLLTPYTDQLQNTSRNAFQKFPGPLDGVWASEWTQNYRSLTDSPNEYLGRAWCRLEMYLGANAPLSADGFHYYLRKGILREGRPHFLTGDHLDGELMPLPHLSRSFMINLNPLNGVLTDESDLPLITSIMDAAPLKSVGRVGWNGKYNSEGREHGKGTFVYEDGGKFVGEFVDGRRHGVGSYFYTFGDHFEGNYNNGLKHGDGIMRYANGNTYAGKYYGGRMQGTGTLTFANGNRYEGDWFQGLMHGKGKLSFSDGSFFEGTFVNHFPYEGIHQFSNGDRFQGTFKTKQHNQAKGLLMYVDGCRYEGELIRISNTQTFIKNGKGTMYNTDGTTVEGKWQGNKMVSNLLEF